MKIASPISSGETLLLSARLGNAELEQLLGCESCLGYRRISFDEAIIETVAVANGNDITALIKVIVGINSVGCTRLLCVLQFAVTTCQQEALFGVGKMTVPYQIDRLVIDKHTDLNVGFECISAILNFAAHTFALPIKPSRDV